MKEYKIKPVLYRGKNTVHKILEEILNSKDQFKKKINYY